MAQTDTNAGASIPPDLDSEVGRVALETGLVTRAELEHCRELQKQSSDPNQRSLGDLLVEHQLVTPNQVKRIRRQIEEQRKQSKIPGYELISELGKGAM